jgi:hypothetical protein
MDSSIAARTTVHYSAIVVFPSTADTLLLPTTRQQTSILTSLSNFQLLHAGKEYSKADSRYATRDDFIVAMEAVTAFIEGPGCLLIVWGMLKARPWRHVAIVMVSLGQLYGDVLYFGTCLHGGGLGKQDAS